MTVLPGRPRHELKFLLAAASKARFLSLIRDGIQPDRHGDQHGAYRVSSLYYDTMDWQAYYEKLDGVLLRKKFRLRYYGLPEEEPSVSFFEIKHRYGNLISKERAVLAPEICGRLLKQESDLDELAERGGSTVERVLGFHHRQPLSPALIVSYLRHAWTGVEDEDLRVTFDHFLTAHPPDDYLSPGRGAGLPFLPPDQIVLEIKFNRNLPRWLQQRLIQHRLRPVRYSKYVEAALAQNVEAVGIR